MSDDLRTRLEEAGRRPVPGADQAFADALEARLLAVAASLPPVAAPPPRRTRLRLALGGALLAGAALVALVIAIGTGAGRPVAPPELEGPVNTEVALVDGTVLEDPDGLRLPEGAVVRVGEGGSARVGDTLLRPGDVATIEQGRLRVEHGQPVGSVTSGRPTPSEAPGRSPSRSPSPEPTRTPRRTTAPSQRPSATPTRTATPAPSLRPPTPAPTREPATPAPTSVPTRTPAPTRSAPPPTATPSPSPTVIRPQLRARFVAPDGLRVTWVTVPGASSYVLVATGSEVAPAPRPRYPDGPIIGEFSQAPEKPLRFVVPDGTGEVRLLVVALAPDGTVISRSRVVIVATGG